jgi:hypothetical protein
MTRLGFWVQGTLSGWHPSRLPPIPITGIASGYAGGSLSAQPPVAAR